MQHIYLTNKHHHYFVIRTAIDTAKLNDCKIHESKRAMFEFVSKKNNIAIEELEDWSIAIFELEGTIWEAIDWRSCPVEDPTQVEKYISEYRM